MMRSCRIVRSGALIVYGLGVIAPAAHTMTYHRRVEPLPFSDVPRFEPHRFVVSLGIMRAGRGHATAGDEKAGRRSERM